MAPTTLTLAPIPIFDDLPTCSPNLMPFHIDNSGPAPISTYLRIEAASETVGAPPPTTEATDTNKTTGEGGENGSSPRDTLMDAQSSLTSSPATGSEATPAARSASLVKRVTDTTTRFISSFRGRTIQGLKVELPEGYVGVVLRGDGDGNATKKSGGGTMKEREKEKAKTAKAKAKAKGRVTRSVARAINLEGDEEASGPRDVDVEMAAVAAKDGAKEEERDGSALRTLTVDSQFSSFVLWHPDIPVDGGRDEYFRSLSEWTRLAHEIHRIED